MNQFEFVRKYKNKDVRRNRVVTYQGQLFRIAATDGSHLKLRREIWVHPNDDELEYTTTTGIDRIRRHISECLLRIQAKQEMVETPLLCREIEDERRFLHGLETALRHMNWGGKPER